MGFQGYSIDDSITRVGGGTILVPEGEYLLRVVGVEPSPEDHDGYPFMRWTFAIVEGPGGIGQQLRHNTTMKPDAQWGLGLVLNALGQMELAKAVMGKAISTYAEHTGVAAILNKLAGRQLGALLVPGEYNGKARSEVGQNGFYPAGEYAERSKSNLLPRQAALTPVAAGIPSASTNGATQQIAAAAPAEAASLLDSLGSFFKD